MTQLCLNETNGSTAFAQLFRIVGEVETFDVEKTYQDYQDWCAEVFIEDRIDIVSGNLTMTDTEMRWVVLNALHREVQEAIENDAELPLDVDHDHIISTLSDYGFCPAFEDDVRDVCRQVLKKWTSDLADDGR